jgi:hypothetical protein
MTTVTIRNVPSEVHAVYVERAKKAGVSFQEYMRRWIEDLAARAALDELIEQSEPPAPHPADEEVV